MNYHFSNADVAIVFGINHSELLLENELAVIANGATGAFRVVDDAVTVGIASKSLRLLRILLDPLVDQDPLESLPAVRRAVDLLQRRRRSDRRCTFPSRGCALASKLRFASYG